VAKAVQVKFKPDTAQLEQATKALGDQLVTSLVGAVGGIAALSAVAATFVGFIKSGAAAARAHQEAEILLAQALKNRGDITGQTTDRLKQVNLQLSIKKGIDETELANVQRTLALHGVHNSALEEATKLTVGLARVTGQDLQTASIGVSRILEGNIGFLKRYGIEASDTSEAIRKLEKLSTEASGAQKTLTGQMTLLSAEWERFKRSLLEGGDPQNSWVFKLIQTTRLALAGLRGQSATDVLGTFATQGLTRGAFAIVGRGAANMAQDDGRTFSMFQPGFTPGAPTDQVSASPEEQSRLAAIRQAGEKEREEKRRAAEAAAQLDRYYDDLKIQMERELWAQMYEEELKEQTHTLKLQEKVAKDERALKEQQALDEAKLDDEKFQIQIAAMTKEQQDRMQNERSGISMQLLHMKEMNQFAADTLKDAAGVVTGGMASGMASMVGGVLLGGGSFMSLLQGAAGGIIVKTGQQLAITGVIGAVFCADEIILGLQISESIVGAPIGAEMVREGMLGLIASIGCIIGGGAMIGIGKSMGATQSDTSGPPVVASGSSPSEIMRAYGGPGVGRQASGPITRVIDVNYGGPVLASNGRETAQQILSDLRQAGLI
jgi:hypothetical protein